MHKSHAYSARVNDEHYRQRVSQLLDASRFIQILIGLYDWLDDSAKDLLIGSGIEFGNSSSWWVVFDIIFPRLESSSVAAFVSRLCSQASIDQARSRFGDFVSRISILSAKADAEGLSIDNLIDIYICLKILYNPIPFQEWPGFEYIRRVGRWVFAHAVTTPYIASTLYRSLYEESRYEEIIRSQYVLKKSIVTGNIIVLDTAFAFKAFGHQTLYSDMIYKISVLLPQRELFCPVDTRWVANKYLHRILVDAGVKLTEVDLTEANPLSYRGWYMHIGLPIVSEGLPEDNENPAHRVTFLEYGRLSRYFHVSSLAKRVNNNDLSNNRFPIQSLLPSTDHENDFIALIWRTNQFKRETTDYNNYRNSDEHSVLRAAALLSQALSIRIVILNDLEDSLSQSIVSQYPLLTNPSINGCRVSEIDYINCLRDCMAVLAGPSGAFVAGAFLFNKPTLAFDYPVLYGDHYNPYLYYCRSNSTVNGSVIGPDDRIIERLPHNGTTQTRLGVRTTPLDQQQLYNAFEIFVKGVLAVKQHVLSSVEFSQRLNSVIKSSDPSTDIPIVPSRIHSFLPYLESKCLT
jgi:hypothetical protein